MSGSVASHTGAWLTLSCSGLSARLQRALVEALGSADAVMGATNEQLSAVDGIQPRHLAKIRRAEAEGEIPLKVELLRDLGAELIPFTDERYPQMLLETDDPPASLFVQGEFTRQDELSVALVGTRKRTSYGEMVTGRLARELVRRGFTIVSGLALGIDADAHEAALEAGGRTIGVLGCGLDVNYPSQNAQLREQMAVSGAVVTEYAPGTPPTPERFPQRNRILCGLTLGTIVIEAPVKSGALITARLAAEYGREVFAVPGNVTSPVSRGCHALLRDGAVLVESAEDVVEGLGIMLAAVPEREPAAERERKLDELPADQQRILQALSHQPRSIDDVIVDCDMQTSQVSSALMLLEVKGLVKRFPGNQFVRT
ncbi:MAG: DNA-protecting protein DprA [candidate division WS1 bacterium]|nr:DNA-protecting protein DprA [candidate division WS1 bacterium]